MTDIATNLHATTDAKVWTDEFLRIFPDGCDDSDTMLGWFANAIETGRSHGFREGEASKPEEGA